VRSHRASLLLDVTVINLIAAMVTLSTLVYRAQFQITVQRTFCSSSGWTAVAMLHYQHLDSGYNLKLSIHDISFAVSTHADIIIAMFEYTTA
jgi:hypothetical protein